MSISGVGIKFYQNNTAVNISEAAFKAMKDDPQYRQKELLAEYMEKRKQAKKQQQAMIL